MEVAWNGLKQQKNYIFPKVVNIDFKSLEELANAQIVEPNSNPHRQKPTFKRSVSKASLPETLILPNKSIYIGDVQNTVPHGIGEAIFPNGCTYKGFWSNGERCGKGTTFRSDGTKNYDGEWKNNKPNGFGAAFSKTGPMICEGEWEDGNLVQQTQKQLNSNDI